MSKKDDDVIDVEFVDRPTKPTVKHAKQAHEEIDLNEIFWKVFMVGVIVMMISFVMHHVYEEWQPQQPATCETPDK
jgi:hypothetical protein